MTDTIAALGLLVDSSSVGRANSTLDQFQTKVGRAAGAADRFNRAGRDIGTGFARGTDRIRSAVGQVEDRLNRFSGVLGGIRGRISGVGVALSAAFSTVAAGFGLQQLSDVGDQYQLLTGRIRLVTETTEEYIRTEQKLFDAAQKTGSSFETTAQLFSRLGQFRSELGISNDELIQFTENINKLSSVSGAGPQEAAAAITQLSQGLAAGALRGDEFNAVAEQLPVILKLISGELGVTTGQLRELAAEGKITREVVIEAILGATEQLNEQFAGLGGTVGQASIRLNNALGRAVGRANEAAGVTDTLSAAMNRLADAMSSPSFQGALNTAFVGLAAVLNTTSAALVLVIDNMEAFGVAAVSILAGRAFSTALPAAIAGFTALSAAIRTSSVLMTAQFAAGIAASLVQTRGLVGGLRAIGAAMVAAATSSTLFATAAAGLRTALAFIGGPAGLLVAAGTTLAYYGAQALLAEDASDKLEQAQRSIRGIMADQTKTVQEQAQALETYSTAALQAAEADLQAAEAALERTRAYEESRSIISRVIRAPADALDSVLGRDPVSRREDELTEQRDRLTALRTEIETAQAEIEKAVAEAEANNKPKAAPPPPPEEDAGSKRKRTFDDVEQDFLQRRDAAVARTNLTDQFGAEAVELETQLRLLDARTDLLRDGIKFTDEQLEGLREVVQQTVEAERRERQLNAIREARTNVTSELDQARAELDLVGATAAEREREIQLLQIRNQLIAEGVSAAEAGDISQSLAPAIDETIYLRQQAIVAQTTQELSKQIDLERQRTDILQLAEPARRREEAALQRINELADQGINLTAEQEAAIRAQADELVTIQEINEQLIEQQQRLENAARSVASAIASSFSQFVTQGGDIMDLLKDLEQQLLRIGANVFIEKPLEDLLTNGITQIGSGFLPSPNLPASNDNLPASGSLLPGAVEAPQAAAALGELVGAADTLQGALAGVSANTEQQTASILTNVVQVGASTAAAGADTAASTGSAAAKTAETTAVATVTGSLTALAAAASSASAALASVAANSAIGGIGNFIPSFFHTGTASVGSSGGSAGRPVSPAVFQGAPRFHRGHGGGSGVTQTIRRELGLREDEFPAILQRGEAVIPLRNGGIPVADAGGGRLISPLPNGDRVPLAIDEKIRERYIVGFGNAPRFHEGYAGGAPAAGFERAVAQPAQIDVTRYAIERTSTSSSISNSNSSVTVNQNFSLKQGRDFKNAFGTTPRQIADRLTKAVQTANFQNKRSVA